MFYKRENYVLDALIERKIGVLSSKRQGEWGHMSSTLSNPTLIELGERVSLAFQRENGGVTETQREDEVVARAIQALGLDAMHFADFLVV